MKHFMNLYPVPFEMIKAGIKTVEMRLNDDKREKIKTGDQIEFKNNANAETLTMQVKTKRVFGNFEELYAAYSPRELGYADGESALPTDMNLYYSDAEIKKCGVAAIELIPCLHP